MDGWIKLHRKLLDHWIWKDSEYLKAWLYIIYRANYSDSNVLIDSTLINVSRGQFVTSLNNFSKDTGLSIQRTRTFFKLLQLDQMVKVETCSKITKITVCNYDSYQDNQHNANTMPTSEQQTSNKLATTDKKNKEREEKKEVLLLVGSSFQEPPKQPPKPKFVKPTLHEVEGYCLERQNNVNPQRFLDYYDANGWKVGRNAMKDWKATIRTWEKNEVTSKNNGKQHNQTITTGTQEQPKNYLAGAEKFMQK